MSLAATGPGDLRQQRRLAELEGVIQGGLQTFVEVGEALIAIRGQRLYVTAGYATFEDYCRQRWGLARNRAYQLMEAAEVSKVLDTPPVVESQARELAPVLRAEGAGAVREVWESVTASAPPTAARIREAVRERSAPRVVTAVVIDEPTPIAMDAVGLSFITEARRLADMYRPHLADEAFAARFEAVFAAIDAL